jgi:hypothetical protein
LSIGRLPPSALAFGFGLLLHLASSIQASVFKRWPPSVSAFGFGLLLPLAFRHRPLSITFFCDGLHHWTPPAFSVHALPIKCWHPSASSFGFCFIQRSAFSIQASACKRWPPSTLAFVLGSLLQPSSFRRWHSGISLLTHKHLASFGLIRPHLAFVVQALALRHQPPFALAFGFGLFLPLAFMHWHSSVNLLLWHKIRVDLEMGLQEE